MRLVLVEGRNREVRRLMERVGHPVMRLRRSAFAGLTTRGLKLGQWRPLTESEIEQLQTRGHVGSFELPPDPRRKGQTAGIKRVTRQAVSQRGPADAVPPPPEEPGRKPRRLTGKPSHDWQPPAAPKQKQPTQRPRPEAVERTTDGRRRSVVRENGARGRTPSR